jgi:NAD-dependent DNA ligase
MDELLFKNRCVAISGRLEYMTREQAILKLVEVGAHPVDMVHRQLDILILGNRPCWKKKQALELGIMMIGESDFLTQLAIEGATNLPSAFDY